MSFRRKKKEQPTAAPPAPKKYPAGTIDPAKIEEAAERMQKMIERENANREKRLVQLQDLSEKLKEANEKLQDEIDRPKREADAWVKQGCPAREDIKVGKPIKLKPKPDAGRKP